MDSNPTHDYLKESVEEIDGFFGEGYAKANPVILASVFNAKVISVHLWFLHEDLEAIAGIMDEPDFSRN